MSAGKIKLVVDLRRRYGNRGGYRDHDYDRRGYGRGGYRGRGYGNRR